MSVSNVLEFDSARLNSPVAVATAVHDIYRELRRGHRVVALIRGSSWSAQAARWLGYALEQAGVPYTLDQRSVPEQAPSGAADETPLRIVASNDPPAPAAPSAPAPAAPLKIVLLGLGTVGLGVYRHLAARPDLFEVHRVVVRDPARHCADGVPAGRFSTNLWHAINEPADLVIELVGGIDPVGDVVHAALLRGRAVISANKALIATRWDSFARHVHTAYPRLRFSAAVGGSLPVLENIANLAANTTVVGVRAVINGTCNFVLDEVARGASFAEAVALAQRNGFAEADPRADLSGTDAAQKLSLIARCVLGSDPKNSTLGSDPNIANIDPASIECQGIEHLTRAAIAAAAARGRRIRLVASCRNEHGVFNARVRPEELEAGDYLAGARREENRVELVTTGGTRRLAGKGAGRWPTALSVLGDVWDLLETRMRAATPASVESTPLFRAQ